MVRLRAISVIGNMKKYPNTKQPMKKQISLITIGSLASGLPSQAALLFYESFDYTAGTTIGGQTPALGAGGAWADTSGGGGPMTVRANGSSVAQTWAGIPGTSAFPNAGGFLEGERRNENEGSILLATSVTNQFTNGSTIWLSYVAAATTLDGSPDNHSKPSVAIGAGALLDDRAQAAAGQAIGAGAVFNNSSGPISATIWEDNNGSPATFEHNRGTPSINRITPQQLVIARIDFGAVTDTVTSTVFDLDPFTSLTEADFNSATLSTITSTANLDQSTFNTLSFHGSRTNLDEIRIATSFGEAVGIPEPSAGLLTLLGLAGVSLRRRR